MKKFLSFALLYCILVSNIAVTFAQSTTENEKFKAVNIKNLSLGAAQLVIKETVNKLTKEERISLITEQDRKFSFNTETGKNYAGVLNLSLKQTSDSAREIIGDFKEEQDRMRLIGNSVELVLGNLGATKPLVMLFGPIAKQKWEEKLTKDLDGVIKTVDESGKRENFIKTIVKVAANNGYDFSKPLDEASISNLLNLTKNTDLELKPEENGILVKQIAPYILSYIQKHENELNETVSQVEQLKQDDQKFKAETEKAQQDLRQNIKDVKIEFTQKVDKIAKSVDELYRNQVEIFTKLDDYGKKINQNTERITSLESQMTQVQDDIGKLKSITKEHDRLIAENSYRIDVISGYTYQNLDVDSKLKELNNPNSIFASKFSPEKRNEEIKLLEDIKSKETLLGVAHKVSQYISKANELYEGLRDSGILTDEAAKTVGEVLFYINSGVKIGTGIASGIAGNPLGFVDAGIGILNLFGKKKNELTYEQKMLQRIDSRLDDLERLVNYRFDRMEAKLDIVEKKIDNLTEILIKMYENLAKSNQYLYEELKVINYKLDRQSRVLSTILFENFNQCQRVEDIRNRNKLDFSDYSQIVIFQRNINFASKDCFDGIRRIIQSNQPDYFDLYIKVPEPQTKFEVTENYYPVRDYFKRTYSGEKLKFATKLLSYPQLSLDTKVGFDNDLRKVKIASDLTNKALGDTYYNYDLIPAFVDLYVNYQIFYELSSDNNYKPYSIEELSNLPEREKSLRLESISLDQEQLLKIVNYAIIQQSLMSGSLLMENIDSALFSNPNADEVEKIATIFKNDKLLAYNFATYILAKNLRTRIPSLPAQPNTSFEVYSTNFALPKESLKTKVLDNLMPEKRITFKVENGELTMMLHSAKDISIKASNPTSIANYSMEYSPSIVKLLESKKKLENKMIESRFLPESEKIDGVNYDIFKYALFAFD